MFETVLLPLDGSAFSEFAVSAGLSIAREADARLELMTVEDPLPTTPTRVDLEEALEDPAGRYLTRLRDRILQGWEGGRVERTVLRGPVATCIESRARQTGADLVVMASHGRGPVSRLWLGSVTDEFVRHAPCPVLVVRPEEGREPDFEASYSPGRILVPVDRTEVSTAILDRAVDLGRLFDARFRLYTVVPYPSETINPYLTKASEMDDQWLSQIIDEARARLESVAGRLRTRDVEVETGVVKGQNPADRILHEAREWDADLVAMGTHGRGGVPRTILGSVADKVLRGSHLPVLLARPLQQEDAS